MNKGAESLEELSGTQFGRGNHKPVRKFAAASNFPPQFASYHAKPPIPKRAVTSPRSPKRHASAGSSVKQRIIRLMDWDPRINTLPDYSMYFTSRISTVKRDLRQGFAVPSGGVVVNSASQAKKRRKPVFYLVTASSQPPPKIKPTRKQALDLVLSMWEDRSKAPPSYVNIKYRFVERYGGSIFNFHKPAIQTFLEYLARVSLPTEQLLLAKITSDPGVEALERDMATLKQQLIKKASPVQKRALEMRLVEIKTRYDTAAQKLGEQLQNLVSNGGLKKRFPTEEEMRQNGLIQDRNFLFFTWPDTFVGADAVTFMVDEGYAPSPKQAVLYGRKLLAQRKIEFAGKEEKPRSNIFTRRFLFYRWSGSASKTPPARRVSNPAAVIAELEKLKPLRDQLLRIGQQATALARTLSKGKAAVVEGCQNFVNLLRNTLEQSSVNFPVTPRTPSTPSTPRTPSTPSSPSTPRTPRTPGSDGWSPPLLSARGGVEIEVATTAVQLAHSSSLSYNQGTLNPIVFSRLLNTAGEGIVTAANMLHRKMLFANSFKSKKFDYPELEEVRLMITEAKLRTIHQELKKLLSQQSGSSIYIDPRQDSVMRRHVNTGKITPEEMAHIRAMNAMAASMITQGKSESDTSEEVHRNLMEAARAGDADELRILLRPLQGERAAKVLNTPVSSGDDSSSRSTALHVACYEGHVECGQVLVGAGASIEVRNSDGRTALDELSRGKCPKKLVMKAVLTGSGVLPRKRDVKAPRRKGAVYSNPLRKAKSQQQSRLFNYLSKSDKEEVIRNVNHIEKRLADLPIPMPPTWPSTKKMLQRMNRANNMKTFRHHMSEARVLFSTKVAILLDDFIRAKQHEGSLVEKELYQNFTRNDLINRLIRQRPVMFMSSNDRYLLRRNIEGQSGFDDIGKDGEKHPLRLADLMSYDEIALAALMSCGGPTQFLNPGSRFNAGKLVAAKTYEAVGIYVGCVGARFERPRQMEWRHVMITRRQNTAENGYGKQGYSRVLRAWARLYGLPYLPLYSEVEAFSGLDDDQANDFDDDEAEDEADTSMSRYHRITVYDPMSFQNVTCFFDRHIYRVRMRLVIQPFLAYANQEAAKLKKKAYVHVVGLGLGVWMIDKTIQPVDQIRVYADLLQEHSFNSIADVNFSWFPQHCQSVGLADGQSVNGVNIHFSKRDPAEKLRGKDADKLLVAQYAWDGNAFSGNEYWKGLLTASGDPAAAACSTIALIHNPDFNPKNLNAGNAQFFDAENRRSRGGGTLPLSPASSSAAAGVSPLTLTLAAAVSPRKESNSSDAAASPRKDSNSSAAAAVSPRKESNSSAAAAVSPRKESSSSAVSPRTAQVDYEDSRSGRQLRDSRDLNIIQWQFKDGGGTWRTLNSANAEIVSKAYTKGRHEVRLPGWQVSLMSMTLRRTGESKHDSDDDEGEAMVLRGIRDGEQLPQLSLLADEI